MVRARRSMKALSEDTGRGPTQNAETTGSNEQEKSAAQGPAGNVVQTAPSYADLSHDEMGVGFSPADASALQGRTNRTDCPQDNGIPRHAANLPDHSTNRTGPPTDVEVQCGVVLPDDRPCARSLTCKKHGLGAKRAVSGRSLPFDMLLAVHQSRRREPEAKISR